MNTLWLQSILIGYAAAALSVYADRAVIAVAISVVNFAHYYVFGGTGSDVLYYVTACTFDIACALCLMQLRTKLALDMAVLCIVGAAVNFIGLIMWFAYMQPLLYNAGIQLTLGAQILRLIWVHSDDAAGDNGFHRWGDLVSGFDLRSNRSIEGTAK